jgi:O-antigen/teichoic acid export membrane protein
MTAAAQIPSPQAMPRVVPVPAHAAEFRRRLGSISRQSAIYFAGTIFTAAAGYFFKVYLAHALGAEALGLYTLGMSVIGLLGVFNALGLPAAATRFVSEYSSRKDFLRLAAFFRGSLTLLFAGNLLLGAAVLLCGPWIAVHLYHAPALDSYFWLFVPVMFLGVLNFFLGQAMAGYQDVSRRTIITHFIGTPAGMVIAVALISLGFGLTGYLAAQVASAFLVFILLGSFVWNLTPGEARRNVPARWDKQVAAFSAVAFVSSAVDFVFAQADKIVLGHYLDAAQVGIYAVATTVVAFVPIALQSVNQIFSPTIAELHATGNHALLQRLYATLTKWIVIFTLPLALTAALFALPLMAIFGHSFQAGAVVLMIGAIGQLINCAVGSVGYLLMMSGRQVEVMKVQICSAVLMVALSVLLVPPLGIVGAAVASAIAVIVSNVWLLADVIRKLKLFPYNSSYFKLAPPMLVSILFLLLLRSGSGNSPWLMAIAGLVGAYGSFLGTLVLFGLDADDRKIADLAFAKLGLTIKLNGVTTHER